MRNCWIGARQRPSLLPVSKWASGDIRAKIDGLALKDEARRHLPPASSQFMTAIRHPEIKKHFCGAMKASSSFLKLPPESASSWDRSSTDNGVDAI